MDPSTLSRYSEREKNRQEAIFELIKTEANFVQHCQVLLQIFYPQLEPIIGRRSATIIFSNLEDIMLFGTTFLSALEQRQTQSDSQIQSIADLISDYMQGVHIFRPYCSNQANATRLLSDLKRSSTVQNRFNSLKVNGLELEHYLLQPMQRLTRYPLLIGQILKFTDQNTPEFHHLHQALKKVQEVLTATNEAIREQEHQIILTSLSEHLSIPGSDARLNLATKTRFVGPRRLIREGLVTKSRTRKTLHAYLFNDFFLLTKPLPSTSVLENPDPTRRNQAQVMYRAPMALEECQFMPGRDDQTISIVHGSETLNLKVPEGPRMCATWQADLKAARKEVFKALAVARKSKRGLFMAPF